VELGRRWHALVTAFTGGNPSLNRKLKDAYQQQPEALAARGMSPEMFPYVREAMQAAGLKLQS